MRTTEFLKSSAAAAVKGELIGYARVSTDDQSLELQTEALKAAGCYNIYEEHVSGAKANRPQLALAIKDLRPGDTLVVWRLDRLSRSMRDLYERLEQVREAGAGFKSLTEAFDFTTATGRLILGMLAVMAEFERQLTIERTKAGMAVLKAKGNHLGAPVKMTEAKKREARRLLKMRHRVARTKGDNHRKRKPIMVWRPVHTKIKIAEMLGVSTGTLFAFIRTELKK